MGGQSLRSPQSGAKHLTRAASAGALMRGPSRYATDSTATPTREVSGASIDARADVEFSSPSRASLPPPQLSSEPKSAHAAMEMAWLPSAEPYVPQLPASENVHAAPMPA